MPNVTIQSIMLSVIRMIIIMLNVIYAECHNSADFAECHYAECHQAECRGASYLSKQKVLL